MRALLAMIKANLKMTVRNRQAIFWNLAFPAIFILIFGAVFGRDCGVVFDVGIAGDDSAYKSAAVGAMESSDAFDLHESGSQEEELEALEDGDRDVVVVFGPQPESGYPDVQIYYDDTGGPNADIAVNVVRQVLIGVAE